MAVTKTYSLVHLRDVDFAFDDQDSGADVTGLAGGGFAAIGNLPGGSVIGDMFDAAGVNEPIAGIGFIGGKNGAIDQLNDGNLVIATEDTDSIRFCVVASDDVETIVEEIDLGDPDSGDADVAALAGGGFWIVAEDIGQPAGGPDIDVYRRNNDGSFAGFFSVDTSLASDTDACIAALDGGGAAISWTRAAGGNTEIWYAVYSATAAVIKAPTLLDTSGTINRTPAIVATGGGGFAIAYADNGWIVNGGTDIALARLNATGAVLGVSNISNPSLAPGSANDLDPALTRLPNGLLAAGYTAAVGFDFDSFVALIDPATGGRLASYEVMDSSPDADITGNVSLAGFGPDGDNLTNGVAVFHRNYTDGDLDGEALQGKRISTGDGANDTIVGDDFIDVMNGSGGEDILKGLGNHDTWLGGGAGADTVYGGAGDDRIDGGSDGDTWLGGDSGEDYVTGNLGGDRVDGGDGDDTWLGGDAGADYVTGGAGGDRIDGGDDDDTWLGGDAGEDVVTGGLGDDRIDGGDDIDRLYGQAGADYITGGGGIDTIDGGIDDDTWLGGGDGGDHVFGNNGDDRIDGGEGWDDLHGNGGNDNITGGGGGDKVYGNAGADVWLGGGDGADSVYGGDGDDRIDGGLDSDIALNGDAGNDVVTCGDGGDQANGGDNDDKIYGEAGRDTLRGGPGADTIYGGAEAGSGDILLAGEGGNDHVQGGQGNDIIDGGTENDKLYGEAGSDTVTGGLGDDRLEGAADIDVLYGQADDDYMLGGAGGDTLYGGTGIDNLHGDDGDDSLWGGSQNDNLYGGAGLDVFNFDLANGSDAIFDFTNDQDTLVIDPGFGLANAAAVLAVTIQTGNHVRILLPGAGTDIYLWDYLAPGNGNTIGNLIDDIQIA